ncbi:MmgE/PrpD family protein [Alsobacter sp. SYSU M60028]|uniref:MmgE/PrpD family protein n=1 Tax=Alsobacter ponti TaxID=2962936 RepID=A0ABT1LDF0_9HYPH|nr:MmgE/PrpD family protein [Alsobacter ponti]MCP8938750.1 MmgE/PrpD family protein [Alsobacter ponti]
MTAVARTLGVYAAQGRYEDFPRAVREEGRRAMLNWVGCALGGAHEGAVACALAAFDRFSGPRQSLVIGHDKDVDIFLGAFLNSLSSSVHSFNDTHFATVAHPTSPVAAALFALSQERTISGPEFLGALILGNEIQCRIGNMLVTPPATCGVGLSMQGLVGCIGAAVAVGKALGLDAEALTRAIGIAANQSAGLREAHATMSSHFTPANAARAGLTAAFLAESGYGCSETMLDGPKGFAASYATNAVPAAAVEGLGATFEILATAYKPFPCGFVIHPVIDACLEMARRPDFRAEDVERIEIQVNPLAIQLTNRPAPDGRRQAMVSSQHWAAAALVFGKAGLQEGEDAAVHHPAVVALRNRVRLIPREDFGREAAEVTIVRRDGPPLVEFVRSCRGSIGRPMTDEELEVKFRGQASLLLDEAAINALLDRLAGIEGESDVGSLAALLRGPA